MGIFRRSRAASTPDADPAPTPEPSPSESPGDAPIVVVDSANFMDETARGWTVVDFWADWCRPCHQFAPMFEDLAREYEGRVRFAKLDVDANPDISGLLQIRSIPTVVLFDPAGNEHARVTGIPHRRRFTELLDRVASTGGGPEI